MYLHLAASRDTYEKKSLKIFDRELCSPLLVVFSKNFFKEFFKESNLVSRIFLLDKKQKATTYELLFNNRYSNF